MWLESYLEKSNSHLFFLFPSSTFSKDILQIQYFLSFLSVVIFSSCLLTVYSWGYSYFLPIHRQEINILLVTEINQLDVKFTKTTLIKLRENHISRPMNKRYSPLSGIIFLLCYRLSEPNNRTTAETKNILMEAVEPGTSYPQKPNMYSLGLTGIVFFLKKKVLGTISPGPKAKDG